MLDNFVRVLNSNVYLGDKPFSFALVRYAPIRTVVFISRREQKFLIARAPLKKRSSPQTLKSVSGCVVGLARDESERDKY